MNKYLSTEDVAFLRDQKVFLEQMKSKGIPVPNYLHMENGVGVSQNDLEGLATGNKLYVPGVGEIDLNIVQSAYAAGTLEGRYDEIVICDGCAEGPHEVTVVKNAIGKPVKVNDRVIIDGIVESSVPRGNNQHHYHNVAQKAARASQVGILTLLVGRAMDGTVSIFGGGEYTKEVPPGFLEFLEKEVEVKEFLDHTAQDAAEKIVEQVREIVSSDEEALVTMASMGVNEVNNAAIAARTLPNF